MAQRGISMTINTFYELKATVIGMASVSRRLCATSSDGRRPPAL